LMHEPTFRAAVKEAGLNPYLFQMANIREQCSWVTDNRHDATEKAKALVSAAVRRVVLQKPLEPKEVSVNPNVLVVGAGIAGIEAALKCADAGKKVYLVERTPSIGGHMAKFDKTFPTLDCAACILTPKMTTVGRHPNIELLTYSEVEEVSGFVGNFKVKVRKKARSVDENLCTGCGACVENCPVQYKAYTPKEVEVELEPEKLTLMQEIIGKYKDERGALVSILHEINSAYNYLPEDCLRFVSREIGVPLSLIYQIATFYNAFSLTPKGKYIIRICMGTACHVKGAMRILDTLERELQIKAGETTPDMNFSLEEVRCLGCCGLAPVITVNEDLYGKVTQAQIPKILAKYRVKEKEVAYA
ncbi:MAG: NAD(P)H-dependent oxidoreductase subunit E, partial [Candidatus Eremiobacteraeota bacterium]|nr:NAD(P)H-dependent oxidoreductase subunit E [Candidatus Eremiobacteraeota bacterium]